MAIDTRLRETYIEAQVLSKQIKELEKQIKSIDEQVFEVAYILDSFENLKNLNDEQETLIPIHNGIFVKAKIKDFDSLFINVGSSTIVKKSLDDTKIMFKKQLDDINKVRFNLEKTYLDLIDMSENNEVRIQELIKEYELNLKK
jgi:prefoldin alpha subunit